MKVGGATRNNSSSSGSSDNRYFPTATEVKQFSTFDTSIVIRMGILVIMDKWSCIIENRICSLRLDSFNIHLLFIIRDLYKRKIYIREKFEYREFFKCN